MLYYIPPVFQRSNAGPGGRGFLVRDAKNTQLSTSKRMSCLLPCFNFNWLPCLNLVLPSIEPPGLISTELQSILKGALQLLSKRYR